jgi:DNA-binding CsgD family transcriptional regulator
MRSGTRFAAFSVQRQPGHEPFEGKTLRAFQLIAGHVRRALEIQERLLESDRRRHELADMTDQLSVGVVLLSSFGRTIHANRTARRLADQNDGFHLTPYGPSAEAYSQRVHLRRLLRDAASTGAGRGFGTGGSMSIGRLSGRRPYSVLIAPLAHRANGHGAVAVMFITDPDTEPLSDERLLIQQYGLTPREASVTRLMLRGMSLGDAADQLEISRTTAKSHIESAYAKTGTRRQGDLIRTVLQSPIGHVVADSPEHTADWPEDR